MAANHSKYRGRPEYQLVGKELRFAARRRQELTYRQVASMIGVPPRGHHMAREVGQVLREISEDEHIAGRPMLSAIAVSERWWMPSYGFFSLARELGRLSGTQPELDFWIAEERRVFATWCSSTLPPG
jgi:hypothetical protein